MNPSTYVGIRGNPQESSQIELPIPTDGDGSQPRSVTSVTLPGASDELLAAHSAHHAEMQLYRWADRVDLADGEVVAANDPPEAP